MNAKVYLSQIKRIQLRLDTMSEQMKCLRSAIEYVSPQFTDMPRVTSANSHKDEDAIYRLLDMETDMKTELSHLADINATINSVSDPRLRSVLVKRYVSSKSWCEIANELHVCLRTVHRLHNTALTEIEKLSFVGTQ